MTALEYRVSLVYFFLTDTSLLLVVLVQYFLPKWLHFPSPKELAPILTISFVVAAASESRCYRRYTIITVGNVDSVANPRRNSNPRSDGNVGTNGRSGSVTTVRTDGNLDSSDNVRIMCLKCDV